MQSLTANSGSRPAVSVVCRPLSPIPYASCLTGRVPLILISSARLVPLFYYSPQLRHSLMPAAESLQEIPFTSICRPVPPLTQRYTFLTFLPSLLMSTSARIWQLGEGRLRQTDSTGRLRAIPSPARRVAAFNPSAGRPVGEGWAEKAKKRRAVCVRVPAAFCPFTHSLIQTFFPSPPYFCRNRNWLRMAE